jgi:hypothetical protein
MNPAVAIILKEAVHGENGLAGKTIEKDHLVAILKLPEMPLFPPESMGKKVKSQEKRCTYTREAKATLDLLFSV